MTKVIDIEGIGPTYAAKLKEAGVKTVEGLLKVAATRAGRKALAEKSGIREESILEWANRADLFRIKGVGEEYSDLLENAGVDTVPELARRKAESLYSKLIEVNKAKRLVRQAPSQSQVTSWIEQAKTLPRVIEY
ncbi:MAG: DUF4332 domain-containing protein [Chloroflexi bacterium]|jgi:predicted flap endonuclease-1-like 5' DNA nuclease|nr:DUF4332 domain-containing protein [Chloroflexota bacterium]